MPRARRGCAVADALRSRRRAHTATRALGLVPRSPDECRVCRGTGAPAALRRHCCIACGAGSSRPPPAAPRPHPLQAMQRLRLCQRALSFLAVLHTAACAALLWAATADSARQRRYTTVVARVVGIACALRATLDELCALLKVLKHSAQLVIDLVRCTGRRKCSSRATSSSTRVRTSQADLTVHRIVARANRAVNFIIPPPLKTVLLRLRWRKPCTNAGLQLLRGS